MNQDDEVIIRELEEGDIQNGFLEIISLKLFIFSVPL